MVLFDFFRRDERQRLADDFLGRPSKDSFGGWIPERDFACAFQGDDRQRRGSDDGAELLECGAESFFELLSLVDVFGVAVPPDDFAFCVATRPARVCIQRRCRRLSECDARCRAARRFASNATRLRAFGAGLRDAERRANQR